MSTHSPFPWTTKPTVYGTTKLVDAQGTEIGALFNKLVDGKSAMNQNAAMVLATPGLLMAAMRGHGWGDPIHQMKMPHCIMCRAIRQAVGPLTRERVIGLAKMDPDYVSEMIFDDRWHDVWIHLGIARHMFAENPEPDPDPETTKRYLDGEYDGLDAELVQILPTL